MKQMSATLIQSSLVMPNVALTGASFASVRVERVVRNSYFAFFVFLFFYAIKITPPIDLTLEYGVEFIEDDELVEITPKSVRLRKRFLKEHERKRASRD